MTPLDNIGFQPEPGRQAPVSAGRRSTARTRSLFVFAALTCGLALGAGSLALGMGSLAAAAQEATHPGWKPALRLAFVQHAMAFLLDSAGATAAQEAKAHDIVATSFADIAPDPKERDAFRKQALDLLAAPSIDRAAVEKLRAEAVANFDAKSKTIVTAILDIADDLTPVQRAAVVTRIQDFTEHGPMGGPWGGPMGGWMGPHGGRPMDDRTPDTAPDKD